MLPVVSNKLETDDKKMEKIVCKNQNNIQNQFQMD